jgi:hypothetical protein
VVPKVLGSESEVKLVVVDLDTAQIAKTCMRHQFQASGVRRWLLNLPGRGAVYAELSVSGLTPQGTASAPDLKGFTLDPQVPCDESVVKVDAADLRYAVVSGLRDSMYLTADASSELMVLLAAGAGGDGVHAERGKLAGSRGFLRGQRADGHQRDGERAGDGDGGLCYAGLVDGVRVAGAELRLRGGFGAGAGAAAIEWDAAHGGGAVQWAGGAVRIQFQRRGRQDHNGGAD